MGASFEINGRNNNKFLHFLLLPIETSIPNFASSFISLIVRLPLFYYSLLFSLSLSPFVSCKVLGN